MERYNMLIISENSPGLKIIQTDEYSALVRDNPGLIHENCGDFYSNLSVSELSQGVKNALEQISDLYDMKEDYKEELIISNTSTFDFATANFKKSYLIEEINGISFYNPKFHAPISSLSANQAYNFLAMKFMPHLFSNEKEGSLQGNVKKLEQKLMC